MNARTLSGAGLALGLIASIATAQSTFDTSLSQAEASTLLYQTCDRERGRIQNMVSPQEWSHMMADANRILLGNIDTARLNALLDRTSRGSSAAEQAAGEFQYCLIINKINLAEAHERKAKR